MDIQKFIEEYQDYLAPRLNTYEQALYFYIFRHSRLLGSPTVTIGFKSARTRMAMGIGKAGSPMSENQCRENLQSLVAKRCIAVLDSTRLGTTIQLFIPEEMDGLMPVGSLHQAVSLVEQDFFEIEGNRKLILEREGHRCFYCRRKLDGDNYVIEHVISRPEGNNSYTNVVASCRRCNNQKGAGLAEALIRSLYRENFLSAEDLGDRLKQLELLKDGQLKPTPSAS